MRAVPFVLYSMLALVIWAGSLFLAEFLASEHKRAQGSSNRVVQLEKALAEAPDDIELRLEYAAQLRRAAYRGEQGGMLLAAVKEYKTVLDKAPKNKRALLGLAKLCLENGILDQSAIFFERYLELAPEDDRARTNFALALIGLQNFEQAERELGDVIERKPKDFEAHLAQVFLAKRQGLEEEAAKYALRARDYAQSESEREKVRVISGAEVTKGKLGEAATISSRAALEYFAAAHPVLGPKLKFVKDIGENKLRIELDSFPVEAMPEFAKTLLGTKIQEALKRYSVAEIELYDISRESVVLSFSTSGDSTSAATNERK